MTGRSTQPVTPRDPAKVGLPPRPFLYTLDQLAQILSVELTALRTNYVHFEGRSIGFAAKDTMLARNIAGPNDSPEWRVAEQELVRWMRRRGFKYYDRGFIGN